MPDIIGITGSNRRSDAIPESLRNKITFSDMGARTSRDSPQLNKEDPTGILNDELSALESFVFNFFSDVSVEMIHSVVETLLLIFCNDNLSEEQKKTDSDHLLGSHIDTYQYNDLRSLCLRVLSSRNNADQIMDDLIDDLEPSESENSTLVNEEHLKNEESVFVALNDPIRFRNNLKVNPSDIDAHWLENKLSDVNVTAGMVMEALEKYNEPDLCEKSLQSLFSLNHFNVYQLMSANKEIIYWYTKLAWSQRGDERDSILERINSIGLSIEDVNKNEVIMENIPRELDLRVTGIPLNGTHLMTSSVHTVKLPEGSTRHMTRDYEQYNVPASSDIAIVPDWPIVEVSSLPEFSQPAFSGLKVFNVVQSRVCPTVINSDCNVLLSAPTGAGKSNVALLALTKCLNDGFKCICIAPLKALVQEQVKTLQSKLGSLNYSVAELSGDQAIGREQLTNVDVIVATPEKWDVVSRKPANVELLRTVGLVVIDEIHLLHDETRGSVLENIVIRHKRQPFPPRLVGLSATLPNYDDVGQFLNVPPDGLFYFDAKYRPVPLDQKYVGVTSQSPLKQMNAINEACLEKVQEIVIEQKKQVLIFVQSRKDTESTRKLIHQRFGHKVINAGIHHAGLDRDARETAENQFKSGATQVLVSTATLAWGVNLPAAAVIIKGTEYYDPKLSGWSQLSPQDVLQMLGRAGRPGFDVKGEGIIITSFKYLNYFASIATMSMPIQSFLVKKLCDSLNAEISARTVYNIDQCIEWIKASFWYVRWKSDPNMYGDTYTLTDLAHSALTWLEKHNSITYTFPNKIKPTYLGELAANFYISPESAFIYSHQLKPWLSDIDIIRVFSRSTEFSSIPVRQSESQEIKHLASLMPIPIRDPLDSRFAKISVLLQAYISRLKLTGFALNSDVVYVAQSASRLFRAIYEFCIAAKWGAVAQRAHELYLMVDRRQWNVGQSPLRQFQCCHGEILSRMESIQIPWQRYFDLNENDLGRVLRLSDSELVKSAHSYLRKFPRFHLEAIAQPLSKQWLWIALNINPLFNIENENSPEVYWIVIENNREHVLYAETVPLRKIASAYSSLIPVNLGCKDEKYTSPYLFVKLLSDNWLHFQCEVAINTRSIKPPSNVASSNDLIDIDENGSLVEHKELFAQFNLENSSRITQILSPLISKSNKAFYLGIFPSKAYYECLQLALDSTRRSGEGVLIISPDTKSLGNHLSLDESVELWDIMDAELNSRQTSGISTLSNIGCVICDSLHKVGSEFGYYYEALVTRLKVGFGNSVRFVGFGYPVASSVSLGQWLGAKKSDCFNFGFDSLPGVPQINIQKICSSLLVSLWDIIPLINQDDSITIIAVGTLSECFLVKDELELRNLNATLANDDYLSSNSNAGQIIVGTCQQFASSKMECDSLFIVMQTLSLPISDVLTLTIHARRDVTILTHIPEYCASFINAPMPLESNLHSGFNDIVLPEIVKNNVSTPQDAVNWLMSTFLFKRLRQNPSYYQSEDVQDWISELVESTFERLAEARAVEFIDTDSLEIRPLLLSHVAVNNGVSMESLENRIPIQVSNRSSWLANSTANKVYMRVVDARIDLALAKNDLEKLLENFDQCQFLIQSLPLGSSALCQIPWVSPDIALRCQDAGIVSIQDFIGIEDDDLRSSLLGFDNENPKMIDVAEFVNHYPIVDINSIQLINDNATVLISLERDFDPTEAISVHGAPGYPYGQKENWFIFGTNKQNSIIFWSRLEINEPELLLQFNIDSAQLDDQLTAYLICGSYIEADKQLTVDL